MCSLICMSTNLMPDFNAQKLDLTEVVHDLKTPITSIMGFAELLIKGSQDEETQKEFYSIIFSESQRLLALVNNILAVSENIDKSATNQSCNINIQVVKNVKELTPLADKRNIEISIKAESSDIFVSVPEDKMSRILINIIENAIKYNRESGKIFVELLERNNKVFIKIKDTGVGISSKDIKKIFDKRYRGDACKKLNVEGSGLGLSIAKDITESYGGTIEVTSEVGKSTEFIISFPKNKII